MEYIIQRQESGEIDKAGYWLLVYGRRKTGKTFLLRTFCSFNDYFLVKKDGTIFHDGESLNLEGFKQKVIGLLKGGKRVVVDEFQRLDEGVLEEITQAHPKGKLVISGSSMRVIKRVFEPRSPLLGFFTPYKIGFIKPAEIVLQLKRSFSAQKTVELSAFLREPWLMPLLEGEDVLDFVYKLVVKSKLTVSSLIGEVFTEEERELSKKYEAILGLIGSGVWGINEITSILYSRRLIPDPSPTHVIQYIRNLEEMELVEGIKVYKSKKRFYRLTSPLMAVYYYLDSRYDVSERDVSLGEIKPTLQKLVSFEIQNFIADIFAEKYGGRKECFFSPEKELDFIITRRNRIEVVGEVKWKKADFSDVEKFRMSSGNLPGKKIIVFREGRIDGGEMSVLDAALLIKSLVK